MTKTDRDEVLSTEHIWGDGAATDRDSVERIRRFVDNPHTPPDTILVDSELVTITEADLSNAINRIGMLEADFDDCNSERARWKTRAEQAEAKLAEAWDEAIKAAADKAAELEPDPKLAGYVKKLIRAIPNPYRSKTDEE